MTSWFCLLSVPSLGWLRRWGWRSGGRRWIGWPRKLEATSCRLVVRKLWLYPFSTWRKWFSRYEWRLLPHWRQFWRRFRWTSSCGLPQTFGLLPHSPVYHPPNRICFQQELIEGQVSECEKQRERERERERWGQVGRGVWRCAPTVMSWSELSWHSVSHESKYWKVWRLVTSYTNNTAWAPR